MMMCPLGLTNIINSWARIYLPENDLDPIEGIEIESHVTCKYGILSDSWSDVIPALRGIRSIEAMLGDISMFENPGKPDVLKIEVISSDLVELNKRVCETVECANTGYSEYNHHITIAYVNKGKGHKFIGSKTFNGFLFAANSLIFSDSNKTHYKILI